MSVSASADHVRYLKAQHAPRVMVAAAVETYSILSRKDEAAETLRNLKARGAPPDDIREAHNALKCVKELDAAREKVVLLKQSRATPSEVEAAVDHFNAMKEKASEPFLSYPVSPDGRPAVVVESKLPPASLPPPASSSFSNPLTPIPEHALLNSPKSPWWLCGLPSSLLLGASLSGLVALAWHRVDTVYLQNSISDAIQTTTQPGDNFGRVEEMKSHASNALLSSKWIVHMLPSSILAFSLWTSFQIARRLKNRLGVPQGRRSWRITAPIVTVGLGVGFLFAGASTSFMLHRVAARLGLSFFRTLLMGARTK